MQKTFTRFFLLPVLYLLIAYPGNSQVLQPVRTGEVFKRQDLYTNLNNPWEVTYGPDGFLWVTEARGYRVYRINATTGARTTILNISYEATFLPVGDRSFNLQFSFSGQGYPQGGLAGLAIHPDFNHPTSPKPYVFISYIHKFVANNSPAGKIFTNNLVRFTYNAGTNRLESPVTLCDTLPGSNDHNSQRIIIAPEGGVNYVFYASGDMGSGQYENRTRPIRAQQTDSYEGKILRFNLDPDGDADALDRWIPNDNPFNTTSPAKQSAVWSIGIRNNQGFAYNTLNGKLYGSSHGPYSDDEINVIEREKNYGHPLVIGYSTDGNYDGLKAGTSTGSCPLIVSESANAASIGADYREPVFSAYAWPQSNINTYYQSGSGNSQWPSEGWSGLEVYTQNYIPGWKHSLISAGLKWGRLIRNKLNHDGTGIQQIAGADTAIYFQSANRFRDLAISPDGRDIFVIMDQNPATSGPTTGSTMVPACPGCVQKYTFLGYNADGNGRSTMPEEVEVAAGTPGTCAPGTTVVINADNNNLWVPITGPDGNIVAEIHANGNNLGTVTTSFYKNNASVREGSDKRLYMDRNISISVQNAVPQGSTARLRFYVSEAELEALKTAVSSEGLSSDVSGIASLKIRKNNNACGASYTAAGDSVINPSYAALHGTGKYVLQGETKSFSSFYFLNPEATVLALRLSSFAGRLDGNAGLLQWITDHESTTTRFIVERSTDGRSFAPVGVVPARGSGDEQRYSFADQSLALVSSHTAYYRLRMEDMTGRHAYSATIQIRLSDMAGRAEVFPNPATSQLQISMNCGEAGKVQWRVFDNTGRAISAGQQAVLKGKNIATLQVASWPAGVYYIDISGAGMKQRIRFQKI